MKLRLSVVGAATVMVLLTSATSLSADEPRPLPFRHLETGDAEILSAITVCYSRSLACHRLIDEIGASSTIVYLRRGQCRNGKPGSCLMFSTAQSGVRYLQLVLDKDLSGEPLVSAAARELQHVVEVVRAPEVIDRNSFRLLYMRIGFCIYGSGMREEWETEEAQRLALVVSKEVRQSQRADLLARK
jgi:hypothetical protein